MKVSKFDEEKKFRNSGSENLKRINAKKLALGTTEPICN